MGWVRADGAGTPQRLTQSADPQFPGSFTPDGRRLMYSEIQTTGWDLLTIPIDIGSYGLRAGKPEVLLNSRFNERHGGFSPDGKWIAYFSDESGPYEVYVRSFADRGKTWQISSGGGWFPTWARGTKQLLFHNTDRRLMAVDYTVTGDRFVASKPRFWMDSPVTVDNVGTP